MVWWTTIPSFDYKKKNKSKKKILVDGYEADHENTKKILPPAPKKHKKSKKKKNVISEQESSDIHKSSDTDGNPMLGVIQEEKTNLYSKSSEWEHLSEFEGRISGSSDNYLP